MKKIKQTYLRSTYITLAILVLFMVAGSIWDLQISKWIYPGHENSIGQFFAAFGELPAFLALTCAGSLLLVYRERLKDAFSVQDGETCFRLGDDGKCVLLTEDGLCPLQAQFGEKGLCRICASHPRFLEEYGAVQEITLCVSCPEAARLLLEHPEPVSFLTQETHEAVTTPNALDPTLYFAVRAFRKKRPSASGRARL